METTSSFWAEGNSWTNQHFMSLLHQEHEAGFPLTCVSWLEWNPCSSTASTDLLLPLNDTAPLLDRESSSHHETLAAGRTRCSWTWAVDMASEWQGSLSHPRQRTLTTSASYLSASGGKFFTALFKHTINLSSIVFWCCFSCFTISSHTDSSSIWKIKSLFQYTQVETYATFLKIGLSWIVESRRYHLQCSPGEARRTRGLTLTTEYQQRLWSREFGWARLCPRACAASTGR